MNSVKGMSGVELRAWSFPASSEEDAPTHWSLSVLQDGKCVGDIPFAFLDERTALMFATLICELEAALPFVEATKSPGPAMSDPWTPPVRRIKSIKKALAEAINGFEIGVAVAKAKGGDR